MGCLIFYVGIPILVGLTMAMKRRGPWDPVKHCEYNKKQGCAHVDGYLCDKSCEYFNPTKDEH